MRSLLPAHRPTARHRFTARLSAAATALALCGAAGSAAAATNLEYHGGPVISNVEIVQIAWNDKVSPALAGDLTKAYKAILASDYLDWLSEYDTLGKVGFIDGLPGSEQHIGRGSFGGAFVISPANAAMSLTDAEIQAELVAQIESGALPMPKLDAGGLANTLYMFDFPPGIDISSSGGGGQSCAVFLAYHGTALLDGLPIPYGVHPACGASFVVHTHELVEAITDPDAGLVAAVARPAAWRTPLKNVMTPSLEIADICEPAATMVAGYSVAKCWSNFAQKCVGDIPLCDGTKMPPACRPCNAFDSGVACSGAKALCATEGPLAGQCVACTAADTKACSGATPVCDTSASTCVGCLADGDCGDPAAPVCDTATRSCRGCSTSAECKAGVCDTADDAAKGQCVECAADADCKADEVCKEHACAPKTVTTPPPAEDAGCSASPVTRDEGSRGTWLLALVGALVSRHRRRG
jgi:hypothetical protein